MKRILIAVVAAACLLGPLTAYADDTAANQPPVPQPDAATVTAGQPVTIPVLANDSDDGLPDDGQPELTVVAVAGDERVAFTATSVTVSTRATDSGEYSFTYDVSDGVLIATGTVTLTITPAHRTISLAAPRSFVALHGVTLSGKVSPARALAVVLQRRVGAQPWTKVGGTTSDDSGAFTFRFTPRRLQRLRFRAVAGPAISPTVDRTVTAVADAVVSGPLRAADVPWSYRAGCPVRPSGLRRITVTHVTYDGRVRRGRVVVAASATGAMTKVLSKALARRFPFRRLVPADHYYAGGRRTPTGSDLAAMRADNTSAFNCRSVTGNPYRLSQHSYGNAIDINTVRNPYVTAGHVYPRSGRPYLNRSNRRAGMLFADGIVARTFRAHGWRWGARWAHPDYQHFSANGG